MWRLRRRARVPLQLQLHSVGLCVCCLLLAGAGKQKLGMLVNFVAFYVLAVPAALLLGFWGGRGVEGMYAGMVLGPATQLMLYLIVLLRLDWPREAAIAAAKAQLT